MMYLRKESLLKDMLSKMILLSIGFLFPIRGGVLYIHVVNCTRPPGQYAVAVALILNLPC